MTRVGADVINIPGPSVDKDHPAEKPVELWEHLLGWTVAPGIASSISFVVPEISSSPRPISHVVFATGPNGTAYYSKAYAKAAGIVEP